MALSEHLDRWVFLSAAKHINSRLPTEFKITHVEGQAKDNNPKVGIEFRMDGVRRTELCKKYWELWIAVNILFQRTMDNKGFADKFAIAGALSTALDTCIPVRKMGTNPSDTGDLIGHFTVIHDKFSRIQPNQFGQVDKNLKLEQGTVEAHYRMFLSEDSNSGSN